MFLVSKLSRTNDQQERFNGIVAQADAQLTHSSFCKTILEAHKVTFINVLLFKTRGNSDSVLFDPLSVFNQLKHLFNFAFIMNHPFGYDHHSHQQDEDEYDEMPDLETPGTATTHLPPAYLRTPAVGPFHQLDHPGQLYEANYNRFPGQPPETEHHLEHHLTGPLPPPLASSKCKPRRRVLWQNFKEKSTYVIVLMLRVAGY